MEHNYYAFSSAFLNSNTASTPAKAQARAAHTCPPLYHITPYNFAPSLLESEVVKVDTYTLLSASGSVSPAPEAVRAHVMGIKTGGVI